MMSFVSYLKQFYRKCINVVSNTFFNRIRNYGKRKLTETLDGEQ